METDIWNDYPQDLLTEAQQREAESERAWLNATPCVLDPYNLPLPQLIARWWQRKFQ